MKEDQFSQNTDRNTQRRQLANWLAEWELQQLLEEDEPSEESRVLRMPSLPGTTYQHKEVSVGDIVLLQPARSVDEPDGLLYAVLLENPTPTVGQWFLVPFSRFAVPALPSEWVTGLRAAPLRVLCCWNYRQVSVASIPPHWRVRRLNKGQRVLFAEVVRCLVEGTTLSERHHSRVGPPLLHPGDPRHRYMEEERARLDRQIEQGVEQDGLSVDAPSAPYVSETLGYDDLDLLAAESRSLYGLRGGVYVTADEAYIVALYPLDAEQVRVRIVNRDGISTTVFDRGYLEAEDSQRSGRIEQGVASASKSMALKLRKLFDAAGQARLLKQLG